MSTSLKTLKLAIKDRDQEITRLQVLLVRAKATTEELFRNQKGLRRIIKKLTIENQKLTDDILGVPVDNVWENKKFWGPFNPDRRKRARRKTDRVRKGISIGSKMQEVPDKEKTGRDGHST